MPLDGARTLWEYKLLPLRGAYCLRIYNINFH